MFLPKRWETELGEVGVGQLSLCSQLLLLPPMASTPALAPAAFIFSHSQTVKIWRVLSINDMGIVPQDPGGSRSPSGTAACAGILHFERRTPRLPAHRLVGVHSGPHGLHRRIFTTTSLPWSRALCACPARHVIHDPHSRAPGPPPNPNKRIGNARPAAAAQSATGAASAVCAYAHTIRSHSPMPHPCGWRACVTGGTCMRYVRAGMCMQCVHGATCLYAACAYVSCVVGRCMQCMHAMCLCGACMQFVHAEHAVCAWRVRMQCVYTHCIRYARGMRTPHARASCTQCVLALHAHTACTSCM